MPAAVTTDDIYKRYLDKAIREILRLEHEVAEAAGGAPVAQPTGHPLGTVFLLKYGPQAQELQEGVAFHGRAGHAIKRSLERLHVDPAEVFGTNCVKFAGADEDECRPWLARELRIVQPRLVVVMGEDALEFVNELALSAFAPARGYAGRAAALHPDDRGAGRSRHRPGRLDDQPAKTRFWNSFKSVGPWWAELPPY